MTGAGVFDRVTRGAMLVVGLVLSILGLCLAAPGMPFMLTGQWLIRKGEGK